MTRVLWRQNLGSGPVLLLLAPHHIRVLKPLKIAPASLGSQAPPWHINPGMIRWNVLPQNSEVPTQQNGEVVRRSGVDVGRFFFMVCPPVMVQQPDPPAFEGQGLAAVALALCEGASTRPAKCFL